MAIIAMTLSAFPLRNNFYFKNEIVLLDLSPIILIPLLIFFNYYKNYINKKSVGDIHIGFLILDSKKSLSPVNK